MHSQGASNINYSTVVFKFDVCRLSCTNYGVKRGLWTIVFTIQMRT